MYGKAVPLWSTFFWTVLFGWTVLFCRIKYKFFLLNSTNFSTNSNFFII